MALLVGRGELVASSVPPASGQPGLQALNYEHSAAFSSADPNL
ncbi:hypothetical protein [Flaviaesturariibacter amylovorans]